MRGRSRGRLCRRSTLIALSLLLFASSLLCAVHWIAVPHRLCEIHGTIEHGTAQLAAEHDARPSGPVYREHGASYEECALGPFTRSEMVVLPESSGPRFALEEGARLVLRADPLPAQVLFGLAPSRSPPA